MTPTPSPHDAAMALREHIRAAGLRLGLARVGFTSAEPLAGSDLRRWQRWLSRDAAQDLAGVMTWLRRPTPRRTHPTDLLAGARTAIVVLAGYYQGNHPPPPAAQPAGKVARYAWGEDYHHVVREQLEALAGQLAALTSDAGEPAPETRICVDSAPLDERALAVRAGLGFIGKNTLLLDPERGSWHVIGVLLTTLELPPDAPMRAPEATCGSCRRCLDACPTGALTGPWQMEPRRCISYATIEDRGPLAPELRARLSGWAFGCDICQEVCPFNGDERVEAGPLAILAGLHRERGIGPWLGAEQVTGLGSREFKRKWRLSPIVRPGRKKIINLLEIDQTNE